MEQNATRITTKSWLPPFISNLSTENDYMFFIYLAYDALIKKKTFWYKICDPRDNIFSMTKFISRIQNYPSVNYLPN